MLAIHGNRQKVTRKEPHKWEETLAIQCVILRMISNCTAQCSHMCPCSQKVGSCSLSLSRLLIALISILKMPDSQSPGLSGCYVDLKIERSRYTEKDRQGKLWKKGDRQTAASRPQVTGRLSWEHLAGLALLSLGS